MLIESLYYTTSTRQLITIRIVVPLLRPRNCRDRNSRNNQVQGIMNYVLWIY